MGVIGKRPGFDKFLSESVDTMHCKIIERLQGKQGSCKPCGDACRNQNNNSPLPLGNFQVSSVVSTGTSLVTVVASTVAQTLAPESSNFLLEAFVVLIGVAVCCIMMQFRKNDKAAYSLLPIASKNE